MGVTAILLGAMTVCLVATVNAADVGNDSLAAANDAGEKLGQMKAELAVATQISTFSTGDVLFTVPDRTGDGVADTIEYTWSGVPGSPVYRSFNGATPAIFIRSAQDLGVSMATRAPAVATESAEQVLVQCDAPLGATYTWDDIDDHNWDAQYVRLSLPAGTVSWKITRVRVYLRQKLNATTTWSLRITGADASLKPTTSVYATVNTASSAVSTTGGWMEFAVGPVSGLSPTQGICILIDGVNTGKVSVQWAKNGTGQPFNSHFVQTTNSGSSWSSVTDAADMRFVLLGTYTTLIEP